jgi:hypothetical protein
MSLNRHAVRRDSNEREIIDGLESTGNYRVFQLDRPCDLAVYVYATRRWRMLEVKPEKNARWQPGQRELCETHGIPIVKNLVEALEALEAP